MEVSEIKLIVIFVLPIVLFAVLFFIFQYNAFIRLKNLIEESWRQIDVELQRRYDLIPNLVETVKGYAVHEREVLETVVQLRNTAKEQPHSVERQGRIEGELSNALKHLFAVAEAYPNLKASENYLSLQKELSYTEDRIAVCRRLYNGNVKIFNTRIAIFPAVIVAKMMRLVKQAYFEMSDVAAAQPVNVRF